MSGDRDPEAHIDAASALIGLEVPAEYRAGVAAFLGVAREMAETIAAVPLDDATLELAPVFRLPEPEPDADD